MNPPLNHPLIPWLNFLLVTLNSRVNASLRCSWQSNACLLMQTPLIPTEQTLHNYKQCQTHSYPAISASQSHRERHSYSWQFRDRLCLHSDLPSSPWPLSLTQVCLPERPAKVGQTWQEALIRSHFEIKEGEALTLNMTNEGSIDFFFFFVPA